ncbi:unnamed protein product [Mytilus coruscus]|uniref:Uncharacterized protein n=1 Tax=Mytilus coruscus TaxID=42192 RepID=A0A6J8C991_MYTCO|nr:unnamed protein product [Mytilus coruscus]
MDHTKSVQFDKCPTSNTKKADIHAWLRIHDIQFDNKLLLLRPQLLALAKASNQTAVAEITVSDWEKSCRHVANIDAEYRKRDIVIDEHIESLIIDMVDSSDNASNTAAAGYIDNLDRNIFLTGFWSQLSSVKHTEPRLLYSNLNATVLDSRVKTTVTKYIGGVKRFLRWTQKYKEISSVLPCNKLYVGLYLQHLIESPKGFNSVDTAFYSIKWAHRITGVTDPCKSELVKNIIEGVKRILLRPIKKKDPVDSNSLIKLFNKYQDRNSLKEVHLPLMCSLMYTGFLSFNELCNITAKNIVFHTSHFNIFIYKTRQSVKHIDITLSFLD